MPQLSRIESIFLAARDRRSKAERGAYLDGVCGGDAELRGRIEALLAAEPQLGGFLEPPAQTADFPGSTTIDDPADVAGRIIAGKYKLLERIGEGGMGEVWVAEQFEPVKRRVAIKLIKPGMDSRAVLARFEAERQALALMDHPNIAKVLDAGTIGSNEPEALATEKPQRVAYASGSSRPYFVMELVKGVPITQFCDERKLTTRQRLELFVPVCQAIQHAHQKGIIHRDIKPSNVLVALHDERPVPKVIDFGVAKAVGLQLTEKTLYTGFGTLIGTPSYMAPEQATFNQLDVDTRADIYSLGVLLYELLAGSPPFEPERLKKTALEKALRLVREEEPPRPSQRLSSSEAKTSIAALRQSEPAKLTRLLRGELDWVVMKALEKDRTRRYETANGFANDVQRYLAGEAVLACPPSPGYRFRKFARRNRTAMAMGGLGLLLVLTVGALAASLTLQGMEERRKQTERERDQFEKDKAAAERDRNRIAFEHGLLESQNTLRDFPPLTGWSRVVQNKLHEVLRIRPVADLRDYAEATLVGLDATQVYEHLLPWPPQAGQRGVGQVVFSPDGSRVLCAGWSAPSPKGIDLSPALLWDGNAANKPTESTRPGAGPVAFPDANSPLQLVVPVDPGHPLTLWNVGTNAKVVDIPLPGAGEVVEAALSQDAQYAASSLVQTRKLAGKPAESVTILWAIDWKAAVPTAKRLSEWPGASTALAFSPDGLLLATGSETGEVVVRSLADMKTVHQFDEGKLPIAALGFGRNYRRTSDERPALAKGLLAVGSKGGGLSVWDLRTRTRMNSFRGSEHAVFGVAFSPDGSTLASAGRNLAFLWDVATGRPLLRMLHKNGGAVRSLTTGVAFSGDGRRVAFGSPMVFSDGGLDVFRLDGDRGIHTYRGLTGVIEKMWLSPSGRWVAALAQNWQLGVWDRATGHVAYIWDVPAGMTADNSAVAFDENDGVVLFASGERVSRWKLTTGERTGSWEVPFGLNDGLVTRPGKNTILVRRDPWDNPPPPEMAVQARELGPNGKLTDLYKLTNFDARVMQNTFLAADGRVLLVIVKRNQIRGVQLYDGLSGKLLPLDEPNLLSNIAHVALSDTGKALALDRNVYRLPDLKRIGIHPFPLEGIDDEGKLGVMRELDRPLDIGVGLYRVGGTRPLVTFDNGRAPSGNAFGMSPDGRFVFWGRRDGTACVADVNKCLEQLTPFGKR